MPLLASTLSRKVLYIFYSMRYVHKYAWAEVERRCPEPGFQGARNRHMPRAGSFYCCEPFPLSTLGRGQPLLESSAPILIWLSIKELINIVLHGTILKSIPFQTVPLIHFIHQRVRVEDSYVWKFVIDQFCTPVYHLQSHWMDCVQAMRLAHAVWQ